MQWLGALKPKSYYQIESNQTIAEIDADPIALGNFFWIQNFQKICFS